MELDNIINELENRKYTCETFVIPACGVGAHHKRDRVWIIANTKQSRWGSSQQNIPQKRRNVGNRKLSNGILHGSNPQPNGPAIKTIREVDIKTSIRRKDDGISGKLDEGRIKGLGNAIVPQVVVPIMQAIKDLS